MFIHQVLIVSSISLLKKLGYKKINYCVELPSSGEILSLIAGQLMRNQHISVSSLIPLSALLSYLIIHN